MLRTKINYFLIVLLMFSGFLYSQTKDYKQLYSDLTRGVKSNQEFHEKTTRFFNSMDNKELPLALADISKEEDVNFIVYNLFTPNNVRLKNDEFRGNMIMQLANKSNSSEFKVVLIDFVSQFDKKDDKHLEEFNNTLFEIAKNKNNSDNLRSYAASHFGISKDYETSKNRASLLFESNNIATINGTANAIVKFLPREKGDYWTNILINVADKHSSNLNELGAVIRTLSLTKTNRAKDYLLNLFDSKVATDPETTEILVYSLSNLADTKVFNKIFTEYSKHEHYNTFGSELTLKQIVSENNNVVTKLYDEKDEESKLSFLRAVRLMKDENRTKYFNKVKESLNSDSETERLESVKTLHFLLSYEEETKIFKKIVVNEKSDVVKNQIHFYVGE